MTNSTFLTLIGVEGVVFLILSTWLDRLAKDRHGGPLRLEGLFSSMFPDFYIPRARKWLPLLWVTWIAIACTVLVYSCGLLHR
jgi:hypothetical protein